MLGEVVAVGSDEPLELGARERLDLVFEELAVAGLLDLDEVLERGGGGGVLKQRLCIGAQLENVP